MKTILRLLLLGVAVVAQAQTPAGSSFAPPLGGMTITVTTGQTQHVSLPLLHAAVGPGAIRGRIDSIGTGTINVPTAGWTPSAFSDPANPYYLRILTGSAAGRIYSVTTTANTATQLNIFDEGIDLSQHGLTTGATGDVYELVLADTLISLFGTSTLQGGTSAITSDNVQVWNGASWFVFYFNTTRNRWERDTDTGASLSRNNFVLQSDRGIMIVRRAAVSLNLVVTGRVPDVAPKSIHLRPGFSSVSLGVPVTVTLGSLALQTHAPGWQSGTAATAPSGADLIQVWGGASFLTFYFDSTNHQWQRLGSSNTSAQDSFGIPLGHPIMVRRTTTGTAANDFLIPLVLPYTIVTS